MEFMDMICINVNMLGVFFSIFVIMNCFGREQGGRRGLFASGTNQIVLGGFLKHTAKRRITELILYTIQTTKANLIVFLCIAIVDFGFF